MLYISHSTRVTVSPIGNQREIDRQRALNRHANKGEKKEGIYIIATCVLAYL